MTDEPMKDASPEDCDEGDVKVFLVNRRDIVRRGLHAVIEDSEDLVVVGEAADSQPDLEAVAAADIDVAIVDAGSPADAVAFVRTLHEKHGDVPTLILDQADEDRARQTAIAAGADGYIPDDAKEDDIRDAVRRAAHGETRTTPSVERPSAGGQCQEEAPDLTYRERQILRLIARGMTNRQIGDHLDLAEKTVKNYISMLLAKLHLERRTQAAIYQITHQDSSAPPDSTQPRNR